MSVGLGTFFAFNTPLKNRGYKFHSWDHSGGQKQDETYFHDLGAGGSALHSFEGT